jgi:HAE1 family hydrophobic/amphiphilic exporter-1
MKLAELSVRRPVLITCIFFSILILGIIARTRLGTALYPDVTFPVVNVIVPFPGAGPDEIETQVSKPIETALNSLAGISMVRSQSLDGVSIETAVFTMDTDIKFAEQKVTQTIARLRGDLPNGILEPMIRSVDPGDTPVITLSLAADLPESQLFDLADREVRPLLEQVAQVGQVEIQGARKREIQVDLDLDKLKAHEMTAEEVVGRLGAAGMNIPAGQIEDPRFETLVRTVGQFDSLEQIRQTPIRFVGNEAGTTLKEVATVEDGLADERDRVYVNGKRALTLNVFKRSDANTVQVSESVKDRVADMTKELGPKYKNFELSVLRDGAKPVRDGIEDATDAIFLGVILTVLVVLLFLGNLRSTIITSLALPNSLLGAFLFMWIAGFSINITTLAALALAVGLLIDDAIVVRENIFRRIEEGEEPAVAAVRGTNEVALAVVATTLTVLSVFGPVSFLKGIIGQFFKEFGLTICFAMLISLLDSLTIAPMLSAYLRGPRGGEWDHQKPAGKITHVFQKILEPFNRFQKAQERVYLSLLERTLKHPLRVLLAATAIFGLSFVVLAHIPKVLVPSQESGEFRAVLDLPVGVSLEATDKIAQEADRKIHAHPEVAKTILTVGTTVGERNHAEIIVVLKPEGERKVSTNGMKDLVRHDLMELPQVISRTEDLLDIGGGAGQAFSMNITGENMEELKQVTAELVERLKKNPDLKDVDRSYRAGANEIRWIFDPLKAEEFGISSAEAGQELRLLLAGATPARYHDEGREYDVRVRLRPEQRDLRETFPKIYLPNLNHRLIPITDVARQITVETPAKIQRENRKRYISINADVTPGGRGLSAAIDEAKRLLDSGEIKHSSGIRYELSGQTKDFQELLNSVILAVGLSVGAMFLVLASLYESFFIPLAIMLVLPLAICGAFYGLGITGSSLDIYSMIGCVLLMGVAAKNSILLVDYIQEGVRSGKSVRDSIMAAGKNRLRPIMMTSFALIAGMLPMALSLQESARQRAPMAIAVISGVVTSTLLTLVVVPAAYEYILRFQSWTLRVLRNVIQTKVDTIDRDS